MPQIDWASRLRDSGDEKPQQSEKIDWASRLNAADSGVPPPPLSESRSTTTGIPDSIPQLDAPAPQQAGFQSGTDRGRVIRSVGNTIGENLQDLGEAGIANMEVALTTATASGASISGGFGETVRMLLGKDANESANDLLQGIQDFTYEPRTERGKELLETIAGPLVALESGVDRFAEVASGGNPAAATIIKTALLGAPELIAPGKTGLTGARARALIKRQKKKVQATADNLGISLAPKELEATVVNAAHNMTPGQKGAHAVELQSAVQAANEASKAARTAAFEVAKTKKAFVNTAPVRNLADDLERSLRLDGFNLANPKMADPRSNLRSLRSGLFSKEGNIKAVHLREIEAIRRATIQTTDKLNDAAIAANTRIRHAIDNMLDDQFNSGMIRGDQAAIEAWKKARAAHASWKNQFMVDKTIKKLVVDLEATPESITNWVIGATSTGAQKQAAATIARLKGILGDKHPAINGIRQDFLYNVAEPLIKETPNFGQFLRNYDATIRKNPSIVKALDLNGSDLAQLEKFVRAQQALPAAARQTLDLYRAISQFTVGHDIARAGLRVRLAETLARVVAGGEKVTKKRILGDLANATFDAPIVPPNSQLAAEFIAGAALTSIPESQREEQ